jgi:hypothetical protein
VIHPFARYLEHRVADPNDFCPEVHPKFKIIRNLIKILICSTAYTIPTNFLLATINLVTQKPKKKLKKVPNYLDPDPGAALKGIVS